MSGDVLLAIQQTQPKPSTILQGILLGIFIIFVFGVFATGFTAKRISNIHNPTYTKAFLATLLKNITSWAGLATTIFLFQLPPVVAFFSVATIFPIVVYRLVFASMWREAALIWIVVFALEIGLGYLLTVVGMMSLGAAGAA